MHIDNMHTLVGENTNQQNCTSYSSWLSRITLHPTLPTLSLLSWLITAKPQRQYGLFEILDMPRLPPFYRKRYRLWNKTKRTRRNRIQEPHVRQQESKIQEHLGSNTLPCGSKSHPAASCSASSLSKIILNNNSSWICDRRRTSNTTTNRL